MQFPKHISIIPDGNRTRAKQKSQDTITGHLEGVQRSKEIIQHIFDHTDVEVLTLRGLSTENTTKRPSDEVSYLMNIFMDQVLDNELNTYLTHNQINYRRIGSPHGISKELHQAFQKKTKEHTYPSSPKTLCIAINYGGRDEITRAIQRHLDTGKTTIQPEDIANNLDTRGLPDVDLIIRTKAQHAKRLSGFMSWQAAYAELYFTDTLFPDFTTGELDKAIERFSQIHNHRNFGK